MGIISFFEVAGDEITDSRDATVEHTRVWTVQTDTRLPPMGHEGLLSEIYRQHPELRPFGQHPQHRGSFVTQPRLRRTTRWVWELIVPYSTRVDIQDLRLKERGFDTNPVNFDVRISSGSKLVRVIEIKDRHGNPLDNTARDPFVDIEDYEVWLEFNFVKNVSKIESVWMLEYPNAINEEDIKILGVTYPAGTLWCESLRHGEQAVGPDGITLYYPFFTKLTYREDGWDIERLNTGTREIYAPGLISSSIPTHLAQLVPVRDSQGEAVDEPVFLDKLGRAYRIRVDSHTANSASDYTQPLRTNLEQSEIITLKFEVKKPLPFKKLPIH